MEESRNYINGIKVNNANYGINARFRLSSSQIISSALAEALSALLYQPVTPSMFPFFSTNRGEDMKVDQGEPSINHGQNKKANIYIYID
jgi:hypothetical protein